MDLSKLNPPQREAVITTEGPLLVLAGAGSGKTRVITHRIVHILNERPGGALARNILAVTFTNKAATEMKERLVKMAGPRAQGVLVCTFHAFGAEMLREDIHRLGWPRKFAIADMGDQLALIRRAMRDHKVDDRAFDARKVLTLISKAKNSGHEPTPKPEGMGDDYDLITHLVYPNYQLALKAQGSVDFDDLLLLPARLLREHEDLSTKYTRRFRYLLVDEFQDTNLAQMNLLRLLAGKVRNVCAVGDDDQAIYSWRGAEVRNILQFDSHFPGSREVRLEQNYRSMQVVLDAANAVIAKNPERKAKRMWTDRLGGERVKVVTCPNEEEEARFVAHEIQKQMALGVAADDIAVLYRTNGQSRPVEEMLREKGIGYEVVGGSEFFDRREVKDVIAYFKVIANPRDEVSLLRIVNVPARGIGDVTMERLHAHARADGISLWAAMGRSQGYEDLPAGAAEKVGEFLQLIERYRGLFEEGRLAQVTRQLLEEIGFREATRALAPSISSADKKLKSVDHVLNSLESFEKREGPKASLLTYLNRLSLDTRQEEEEVPGGHRRVTLMTVHASKGLEYRLVFFIGMEEDLMPHKGMQGEPQNLEEERRLCYVGITRAKELLYLTRAAIRVKRGKEVPCTPSRFLEDLPPEVVEKVDLAAPRTGAPTEQERNFFANLKDRFKPKGAGGGAGPTPGDRKV
ncbi:ATP-dependent helicase [Stigmatella aurantiaca]|uniref:DNA 3'-5' helicase n=1 Tax=Stigmatella aurantiaca (strain DW4/3-1) TaxID=378806 RepID=Q08VJ0_STIAD|nr:UvrD-helicase domain-containing protein [Stigmatella aurantiaca]ADO70606.1 ATP-dependent DNA helicase, UvrD/REP family [Stigmatella aurantiaca DW4/3-1]EAU64488.1 ATP-dependent DNA helicase PcrA [Stigmatella aurantiaca DW4/3-1]